MITTRKIALRTVLEFAGTAKTFLGLVLFTTTPPHKKCFQDFEKPPQMPQLLSLSDENIIPEGLA
jgi:hypothetical protein